MVVELIIPALGVLGVSGAVGAVVYYLNMKRVEQAFNEINETQDMRDKRIREAIKETLVNDLDKIKTEGVKISETVNDSIEKMKRLEVERNEFKKEVADFLRMQLKDELGSRLRDAMNRLTQVSDEQSRLEDLMDSTKKDVKGGVLQITNKIASLKDETRKVEDKFIQIQDMFHNISSRKDELEEDILQSLRKKGIKEIDTRLQELGAQVRLTKDMIAGVENDKDLLTNKIKGLDLETSRNLKVMREDIQKQIREINESSVNVNRELGKEVVNLRKENAKLLKDFEKFREKVDQKPKIAEKTKTKARQGKFSRKK